jgi:hypothetical protein
VQPIGDFAGLIDRALHFLLAVREESSGSPSP